MSDKCERQSSIYEVFRQLGLETAEKRNHFQRLADLGTIGQSLEKVPHRNRRRVDSVRRHAREHGKPPRTQLAQRRADPLGPLRVRRGLGNRAAAECTDRHGPAMSYEWACPPLIKHTD